MTIGRGFRAVRRLMIAIAVAGLLAPGTAAGQAPPGDISGVDQYVELLPDAGGKTPVGIGGGTGARGKPPPLSPTAKRGLREHGGSDAPFLEAIATLPEFGAPGSGLRSSGSGSVRSSGSGSGTSSPSGDDESGAGAGGRTGDDRTDGLGGPGAAEGIPDVSLGEAVTSAVGALADPSEGGGPNLLVLALLAISGVLVSTAVWRAYRRGI